MTLKRAGRRGGHSETTPPDRGGPLHAMSVEEASRLLQNSRKRIDDIDVTLVDLLNRRAGVVEDVASAKRVLNKDVDDPGRREQVLAHARAQNGGPLSNEELTSIFERIIDKMSDHQLARLKTGRS
jgi:chorismate mutase